jgi:hypothetical protein
VGLLDRLGLRESEPKSDAERQVERVRVLEAEAFAARERAPVEQHHVLSCGHRTVMALRPGQPTPRYSCPICLREADEARQGGRRPFQPEDTEFVLDAVAGRVDSRDFRRLSVRDQQLTDRWIQERRDRGEVLSHSEQEAAALSRIQELRREEEEAERIRAMSSEEKAELAASNWRRKHGAGRGGAYGRYQPSPARCGLP